MGLNLRKAGSVLGITGLGAAAGVGTAELLRYLSIQGTPMHSREMTQEEHAKNNLSDFRERYSKVTPTEMALFEGIRQGLMAGEISGEEVNMLAAQGELPSRVVTLLTDVHDWGMYPTPWEGQIKGSEVG